MIRVELTNSRYSGRELKEYAFEFIHYSKYAGINLVDFHSHLNNAKIVPFDTATGMPGYKLVLSTTKINAERLQSILAGYPVFSSWRMRVAGGGSAKKTVSKKTAAKSGKAKKSPAKPAKKPARQAVKKSKPAPKSKSGPKPKPKPRPKKSAKKK